MRKRKKKKENHQPPSLPVAWSPPCLETPGIIAHMHVSSRPVAQREKRDKQESSRESTEEEGNKANKQQGGLGV
jgi:hypothetical protein